MPELWICPLKPDEYCPHATQRDYLLDEIEKLRDETKEYIDFLENEKRSQRLHPNSVIRYKDAEKLLEKLNKWLDPESFNKHKERMIER